jgi:predicted TPR repeat methyltransferase
MTASIDEFEPELTLARVAHAEGRARDAEEQLRALAARLDDADRLHALGLECLKLGATTSAEACFRRALEFDPGRSKSWNNLGNLHKNAGRVQEALDCYGRAIDCAPSPAALMNRGRLRERLGSRDEALDDYLRGLSLEPHHETLQVLAGLALARSHRWEEALERLRSAFELGSRDTLAQSMLYNALQHVGRTAEARRFAEDWVARESGVAHAHRALATSLLLARELPAACEQIERTLRAPGGEAIDVGHWLRRRWEEALYLLGRHDEAREVVERWLRIAPDDPDARHMFAAYTGIDVPERANDAYVRNHFDEFASHFDHGLRQIGYQLPEHVESTLARLSLPSGLDVLDAGCGTGLLGPLVRHRAVRLVGVDLSPRMLERAADKGVYDELVCAEIGAFLDAQRESFDLITMVDTLIYFGSLEALFARAAAALRPGGIYAVTVERMPVDDSGRGYELQKHGRYRHRIDYVQRALVEAGFEDEQTEQLQLRKELGEDVAGLIITARRSRS